MVYLNNGNVTSKTFLYYELKRSRYTGLSVEFYIFITYCFATIDIFNRMYLLNEGLVDLYSEDFDKWVKKVENPKDYVGSLYQDILGNDNFIFSNLFFLKYIVKNSKSSYEVEVIKPITRPRITKKGDIYFPFEKRENITRKTWNSRFYFMYNLYNITGSFARPNSFLKRNLGRLRMLFLLFKKMEQYEVFILKTICGSNHIGIGFFYLCSKLFSSLEHFKLLVRYSFIRFKMDNLYGVLRKNCLPPGLVSSNVAWDLVRRSIGVGGPMRYFLRILLSRYFGKINENMHNNRDFLMDRNFLAFKFFRQNKRVKKKHMRIYLNKFLNCLILGGKKEKAYFIWIKLLYSLRRRFGLWPMIILWVVIDEAAPLVMIKINRIRKRVKRMPNIILSKKRALRALKLIIGMIKVRNKGRCLSFNDLYRSILDILIGRGAILRYKALLHNEAVELYYTSYRRKRRYFRSWYSLHLPIQTNVRYFTPKFKKWYFRINKRGYVYEPGKDEQIFKEWREQTRFKNRKDRERFDDLIFSIRHPSRGIGMFGYAGQFLYGLSRYNRAYLDYHRNRNLYWE